MPPWASHPQRQPGAGCHQARLDVGEPMASPTASPFEPVLRRDLDRLPQQFRDQYLVGPDDAERAVLTGTTHRVWHRPRWIWPMLRLLAVFDIIFPEQGSDVAAEMIIEGADDPSGRATQVWRRSFAFSSPRRFDAIMTFDSHQGRVVEWLRPANLIEVVWDVAFEPPATIRIIANRARIGRGRWHFTLPRWAGPEVSAVETADADVASPSTWLSVTLG